MESTDAHPRVTLAEDILGHQFRKQELLREAISHGSLRQVEDTQSNTRLGFLGDAVLQLAAAYHLYASPSGEGIMTDRRKALVNNARFDQISREVGLDKCLLTGPSMAKDTNAKTGATLVEALIGAVFLDTEDFRKTSDVATRLLKWGDDKPVADRRQSS